MRNKIGKLVELIAQCEVWQRDLRGKCGDVNYSKMRIRINNSQTVRAKASTILHEALHMYYWDREIKRTETEIEKEAQEIATWLYD